MAEQSTENQQGQQGAGRVLTEEERKRAQESVDAAMRAIQQSPLGRLAEQLGITAENKDPAKHEQKAVLRDVVDDIFTVSANDMKRTPGLVVYGGDNRAEDATNNLGVLLQEMFDEKRLVFDKDPAKNKAKFEELKAELGNYIDDARMGTTRFNNDTIASAVHQKAIELGVTKIEARAPAPVAKIQDENIVYGKPLAVNADSPPSVANAGFRGDTLEVYKLNEFGALSLMGKMTPDKFRQTLGDQYTVQAVNFKHNDVIEPAKDAKPPVDAYFVSNARGDGYYLNSGAVDPAKSKLDFDVSAKPAADITPAPVSPAPVIANMNGMNNQGPQQPHPPGYM